MNQLGLSPVAALAAAPPGFTVPGQPRRHSTGGKTVHDLTLSRDLSELLSREVVAVVDSASGLIVILDRADRREIDVPPEVVQYAVQRNVPPPSPAQRALAAFDAATTPEEKLDIALEYLRP